MDVKLDLKHARHSSVCASNLSGHAFRGRRLQLFAALFDAAHSQDGVVPQRLEFAKRLAVALF